MKDGRQPASSFNTHWWLCYIIACFTNRFSCFTLHDLLGTWNEWLDVVSNTVLYDRMFFCDSWSLKYLICSKIRKGGKEMENNQKMLKPGVRQNVPCVLYTLAFCNARPIWIWYWSSKVDPWKDYRLRGLFRAFEVYIYWRLDPPTHHI